MEYEVLGHPPDGPTITLDWESFSYAGKFEMSSTGKAVLRAADDAEPIVAAAAFNGDRETPERAWIRYLTVRSDRQGEGLGARLAARVAGTLLDGEYDEVQIAVNNPIAYRALYKAGFHFTGEETGIAELVLRVPGPQDPATYRAGLRAFADRDLPDRHAALLEEWLEDGTPPERRADIPLPPSVQPGSDGAR